MRYLEKSFDFHTAGRDPAICNGNHWRGRAGTCVQCGERLGPADPREFELVGGEFIRGLDYGAAGGDCLGVFTVATQPAEPFILDMFGNPVVRGDAVIYTVRTGSHQYTKVGVVTDVRAEGRTITVQGYEHGYEIGRRGRHWVRQSKRSVLSALDRVARYPTGFLGEELTAAMAAHAARAGAA